MDRRNCSCGRRVPSAEWAEKTAALYAGTLPPGEDPAQLTPYGPTGLEDED